MLDPGFHQQPIDHYFEGVILALVEIDFVLQVHQFAIDARTSEAVLY